MRFLKLKKNENYNCNFWHVILWKAHTLYQPLLFTVLKNKVLDIFIDNKNKTNSEEDEKYICLRVINDNNNMKDGVYNNLCFLTLK